MTYAYPGKLLTSKFVLIAREQNKTKLLISERDSASSSILILVLIILVRSKLSLLKFGQLLKRI